MIQKKFRFSFPELLQRSDRVIMLLERDATQFSAMGYEEDFKDSMEVKTNTLKQVQPDAYWKGQQMLKTDEKNNLSSRLRNSISDLRFRAKLALGEDSVKYASFGFSRLSGLDEAQLFVFATHVVKTAKNMLEELAVRKVDKNTLGEINTIAKKLDNAIDIQKKAISTREEMVFERREKGNELYGILVECCEVGKRAWDGVNPAFFDDYVIYGSQNSINEDEEPDEDVLKDDANGDTI